MQYDIIFSPEAVSDLRSLKATADTVEVLAIVPKSEAESWLKQMGESE